MHHFSKRLNSRLRKRVPALKIGGAHRREMKYVSAGGRKRDVVYEEDRRGAKGTRE